MTREQVEERLEFLQDLYWSCIGRGIDYPETYAKEYHALVDILADMIDAENS